jgi:hypothetical protein
MQKSKTRLGLLRRFDKFMRSLKQDDRIAIVHDTDPDGLCAAVILAKLVERLRGKKIDLRLNLDKKEYAVTAQMSKKMRAKQINKLLTVDFSMDQNSGMIKKFERFMSLLIIDHHKLYNNVNSKKTILIKPQLFTNIDPARYCGAKLSYDLSNRLVDMTDLDWLAAVASIADIATKPWKRWLERVLKKHKVRPAKELFKTKFGKVASILNSAEVYSVKNTAECFRTLYKANTPDDILRSKLTRFKRVIGKEINYWLSKFKQKAEKHKDLYWFEIRPKHNIHSPMATFLGQRYPHNTVIIASVRRDSVAVSARRSDKAVAVNELLEKATAGLKRSSAGGHVPAAGAGLRKKDYLTFKKRVLRLARNQRQ